MQVIRCTLKIILPKSVLNFNNYRGFQRISIISNNQGCKMTFGKILKILDMVKWLFLCQRLSVNGEISETETSVETSETTKAEV